MPEHEVSHYFHSAGRAHQERGVPDLLLGRPDWAESEEDLWLVIVILSVYFIIGRNKHIRSLYTDSPGYILYVFTLYNIIDIYANLMFLKNFENEDYLVLSNTQ